MLKILGKSRLTRSELEDIQLNSGITAVQYDIIRLKFFDQHHYSVVKICDALAVSVSAYGYQLRQAIKQINAYLESKI